MTEDKKPDNMELWKQVCTTDPATTKHVKQRGGFTAIDAQSQLKRATELWGPYGSTWGVKECKYTHIDTDNKDGHKSIIEVMLEAVFYCPYGTFEIATDISYRIGGDTCKKLLTDLTTKALSKLGFNSDVFEGKFDDNKYVNAVKKKFSKEPEAEPITDEQVERVFTLQEACNIPSDEFNERLKKKYKVDNVDRLNTDDADELIRTLGGLVNHES